MTRNLKSLLVAALREQLATGSSARIPAGGDLIWQWFKDLSSTRTAHAAGANPISFAEMEAYFRLRRVSPGEHHVDILLAMDAVFLGHIHEGSRPLPEGVKALPPISKRPLTAGLFDSMTG
ncbi:hypothetical protein GR138_26795 [Shinella kummerowiae]|uniref:Uncharacterized protein n=1 Tax=Shinella kummerowiae TaxID=417745 RepID=A0A6N8SP93_9HYPH|nr:hypothetical protein [Shinella kummerowiae]MXN48812.1 hypothetical protein [Shinella kummerowiae]